MPRSAPRARRASVAALAGAALVLSSLAAAAPASAATPSGSVPATVTPDAGDGRVVMPEFQPESYVAAAAELPAELVTAIANDLGETPEEYLAGADAAAVAVEVVAGLEESGVAVASSRLEGTELVVTVASESDVAAVEAVDATAEVGEAPGREAYADVEFEALADLVGGQGYIFGNSSEQGLCSTAFNGRDRDSGAAQFVTAGHCDFDGRDSRVFEAVQPRPNVVDAAGALLGTVVSGSFQFGNEYDGGLIATNSGWTPKGTVGTWNSGANNGPVTAGTPQAVRDYGDTIIGQSVCKSGRTTGWSCGTVKDVDQLVNVSGQEVNADVVRSMCTKQGDSGGAVVSGGYAVGLISGGQEGSCDSGSTAITAIFPMIGGSEPGFQYGSIVTLEENWGLSVSAPAPVVNTTVVTSGTVSGTLPNGTGNYAVAISIDGDEVQFADVASDRSWKLSPTGLTPGLHSYTAYSVFGFGEAISRSSTVSGSLFVGTVDRIAGADRYEGAVKISQAGFPGTAPVVYIATGQNYPDALSAGPAAVAEDGPLLLVTQGSIPTSVSDEIKRLAPERIVIVGGPNSVSSGVQTALGKLVKGVKVTRLSGADRYVASQNVVESVFGGQVIGHAYAATGTNFPDALSAGGAAGAAGEPVVLVNGPASSADHATLDVLRAMSTTDITVVGGLNSVSRGVADSLKAVPASVDRVAAADRYLTSIALNDDAFTESDTVYLATGTNFPDALAGGVLAGANGAPLYVVPGDCVPQGVLDGIRSLGATTVVLLGGQNSLGAGVASLTACR
ncbi:cell wall-binding repeat-containing protein [Herbiconiux moechotypicola]|uniref:Uncharacterized protein n=1 Tax=Herbiconiux moechotypicola TaxID=637393 RepID=A0ABP5QID9_9MICO|nr:cell wall-binding repeat-containing protein [Herbiconiux moechotypicola]MCS5730030.1 cell wall-binding repeat-containing protein [Herbiconiux moechotypicola]